MVYTRKENTLSRAAVKRKIETAQNRAQFVGVLYFLANLAIAALCFFPMISVGGEELWVLTFWKDFKLLKGLKGITFATVLDLTVAVLYALVLLTAVCNVFRSFKKFRWLFRRNPSRSHGYNRNVYAMDDLGGLFSGTFHTLLAFTFLIYLLSEAATISSKPVFVYSALGVGFGAHFLLAWLGGNIPLYTVENDNIYEETRRGSRLVPFIRNLLQIAAVAGIGYFLIKTEKVLELANILRESEFSGILGKWKELIAPLAFFAVYMFTLPLLKHATAATEFDREGCDGAGMKTFRVFTFLIVLVAGGGFAVEYILEKTALTNAIFLAAVALAAFVVEIVLRKYPDEKDGSDELDSDEILGGQYIGGLQYGAPMFESYDEEYAYEYYDD